MWCAVGLLDLAHFVCTTHRLTGNGELIHAAHHAHSRVSLHKESDAICERSCPTCLDGMHRCEAGHFVNPRAAWARLTPPPDCALAEIALLPTSDSPFLLAQERLYLLYPKHSPPSPR
ncbi:MAG: hypothetical protein GYA21_01520 [Myxococcales bacterium]|nr:hypothetical protein [Myxococcales bacterium]